MLVNGVAESNEAEYLYGFSQDGYALVLGKAISAGGGTNCPGMDRQTIRADYLMAAKGHEFNPSGPVEKMDIALRHLTEWYGKTAYRMVFDRKGERGLMFKALEYQDEDGGSCVLFEGEQCSISLFSKYSFPALDVGDMTFRHECQLRIAFSSGKSLQEAISFAIDLSNFFSFCMGFHASIQELRLQLSSCNTPVQYYSRLLDSPVPSKFAVQSMPFPYRSIEKAIGSYLGRWLNPTEGGDTIEEHALFRRACDTIVSVLAYDWKMPVELLCVASSQAFEAISRYKADLTSLPKAEFRSNRKRLKQLIKDEPSDFVEWANSKLDQNSKGAQRLASELMERHRDITDWLAPDVDKFIRDQLHARNTYSHGSRAKAFDTCSLYRLTMGTAMIGYAILWSLLGMDFGSIKLRLEESRYKVQFLDWLQQKYGKDITAEDD